MDRPLPGSLYEGLFPPEKHRFLWHMSYSDRCAFHYLLQALRPQAALEIGTDRGGSLDVLARAAERVYSIDIRTEVRERLAPHFANVEFLTGDSAVLIPQVLTQVQSQGQALQFALVDGDHTAAGVRRDIDAVLAYRPQQPMCIVMHDSFNPAVRKGICDADWQANPQVHFVETDFSPGGLSAQTMAGDRMWGGLAVAMLLPQERAGDVQFSQSSGDLFRMTFCEFEEARLSFAARAVRKMRSLLNRAGLSFVRTTGSTARDET